MNEVTSFVIIVLCIPIVVVPNRFLSNQIVSLEILFSKCVVILNLNNVKRQLKTKSCTYCENSSA